jgi:hypothetical protein
MSAPLGGWRAPRRTACDIRPTCQSTTASADVCVSFFLLARPSVMALVTPGSVGSMVNSRQRAAIEMNAMEDQLNELDDIKVKTMFQMVEDVDISTGGLAIKKKFLFLTNKQAASFNTTNMDNVLQALELKESHFVIRLVPSLQGMAQFKGHQERRGTIDEKYTMPPTLNEDDCNRTESQLVLFIKKCILPVAMQTRALILCGGANDCSLAVALQKVMGPVMERLGADCPFSIIGMVFAPEIHARAHEGLSSIAGQFAAQSKTWSRRFSDIHSCMVNMMGGGDESLSKMQQVDMNSACTHMICFETLNLKTQKWDSKPRKSFENTFIESLTQRLPSIVIQAQTADQGITNLGDIVRRKIPLLLLDNRERWPLLSRTENPKHCNDPCTQLAKDTNALETPDEVLRGDHFDKAAVATKLLREMSAKLTEAKGGGVFESWDSSTLAFLKGIANFDHLHKRRTSVQKHLSLHGAIEAENEAMKEASSFGVRHENEDDSHEKKLADVFFEVMGGLKPGVRFAQTEAFIKKRKPQWVSSDENDENDEEALAADPKLSRAKQWLKHWQNKLKAIEKAGGRETKRDLDQWTAVYDILTSPNCFAESIFDLSGISQIMSNVAKIDNLPDKHSREALLLIQHAWSDVDAYHTGALWYKWTAKVCYILMLVLALFIVAIGITTTAGAKTPIMIPRTLGNYLILSLSMMNAVIASLTTYTNPAVRWQILRSSGLSLESEIWQFRTRTGKYRASREASSRDAEKTFHTAIKEIENITLQSGDLRRTMFYSKPKSSWTRHGQNRSRSWCCCRGGRRVHPTQSGKKARSSKASVMPTRQFDNHHSPLRPEEYLVYRLKPMLTFYMRRLPGYSRNRTITKMVTILGSIGGSILAVFDLSEFSVLLVMVISSVVAWSEFAGTEKKLERYSNVVSGLGQIQLWWNALPLVEKLAAKSIDQLVSQVEGQIRNEQQGWRAMSQAAKKIQESVQHAEGDMNGSLASGRNGVGGNGGSQGEASKPYTTSVVY